MANEVTDLLKEAASKKIESLTQVARQAYENSELTQAAKLYHEAAKLALDIKDYKSAVKLLYWTGSSYYLSYSEKVALSHYYNALQYEKEEEVDKEFIYRIVLDIAQIGVYLPSNISSIQKALAQAKGLIHLSGKPHWWGIYKFAEGILEYHQGNFNNALDCFQEGIRRESSDYLIIIEESYYDMIIKCNLKVGNVSDAKDLLKSMELVKTNFLQFKAMKVLISKMNISLLLSEFGNALDYARKLDETTFGNLYPKIHGYLSAKKTTYIKEIMINFLYKYRNLESAIERENICLTWGDYYQTIIREKFSLPDASHEWSSEDRFRVIPDFEIKDGNFITISPEKETIIITKKEMRKWFRNARVAYFHALSFAQVIDEKLTCSYHTEVVEIRFSRLFFLYNTISSQMSESEFLNEKIEIVI